MSSDAGSAPRLRPQPRRRLVLATGNAHKLAEVATILPGWEVVAVDPDVEETGTTFEENALLKAHAVAEATGELAVADDSGIEIDALGGRPGIHSARWAVREDWIPRVLREVAEAAGPGAEGGGDRSCRYVAAAAAVQPGLEGWQVVVRGTVEGRLALAPRGTGGFGYDPIMVPVEGDGRTFAEMDETDKHEISHRGRAFRALAEELRRRL